MDGAGEQETGHVSQTKSEEEKSAEHADSRRNGQKRSAKHLDDTNSDNEEATTYGLTTLEKESIGAPGDWNQTLTSLPHRRAKAARRLLQTKAYTELVEDRILELEQKVRTLSNDKTPLIEVDTSPGDITPLMKYEAMEWSKFNSHGNFDASRNRATWQHRAELDEVSKPIIEILVEEPRYGFLQADTGRGNPDGAKSQLGLLGGIGCEPSSLQQQQQQLVSPPEPYRIRIRSKRLLKLLKYITGRNVIVGPHEHRLLMIRPFKLLVAFADQLEACAKQAEGRCPIVPRGSAELRQRRLTVPSM